MAKNYTRISLREREIIYKLNLEKKSPIEIARMTGRNKSSISRELARCRDSDLGYIPDRAEEQASMASAGIPTNFEAQRFFYLWRRSFTLVGAQNKYRED